MPAQRTAWFYPLTEFASIHQRRIEPDNGVRYPYWWVRGQCPNAHFRKLRCVIKNFACAVRTRSYLSTVAVPNPKRVRHLCNKLHQCMYNYILFSPCMLGNVDNEIATPSLDGRIVVPGVMRSSLLELGSNWVSNGNIFCSQLLLLTIIYLSIL